MAWVVSGRGGCTLRPGLASFFLAEGCGWREAIDFEGVSMDVHRSALPITLVHDDDTKSQNSTPWQEKRLELCVAVLKFSVVKQKISQCFITQGEVVCQR